MNDLRVHVDGIGEVVVPWNDGMCQYELGWAGGQVSCAKRMRPSDWQCILHVFPIGSDEHTSLIAFRTTPTEALSAAIKLLAPLLPEIVKARLRGEANDEG